jgi:hypothetical protein
MPKPPPIYLSKSEKRTGFKPTRGPGPGTYNLPLASPTPIKIPTGPKYKERTPGPGPIVGPGIYDPDSPNYRNSAKFTMGARRRAKTPEREPGPGDYDLRISASPPTKTFSFARSPRRAEHMPVASEGLLTNVPTTFPNAPKYLLPQDLIARVHAEPVNW